jgi:ornithine cyclodeaminase/alanine dehydrogenase-like protein (mu-crystallin family)
MLYLSADDILKAVTLDQVMDSVEEALRIYESRAYVMPDRLAVDCGPGNLLLLMPCAAGGHVATKLVTFFPGNRARNRPLIDAVVMLADGTNGEILALMDGQTVTAMRTGGVTGVSIRHLAREDARSVGLVGCGTQGHYQLLYACTAREIDRITLYDIDPAVIPPFVERLQGALPREGIEVQVAESTPELVEASDIVITATTAHDPVFPDEVDLFKGRHFVAIGSFQPEVREYPDALFRVTERVWIDIDFAVEEAGELIIPLREGTLRREQLETLGHFILSGRPPERGEHGTTFFKTVGMALFDLTAARLAYERALQKGLGTRL